MKVMNMYFFLNDMLVLFERTHDKINTHTLAGVHS